jgi:hypothetical protein
MVVLMAVSSAVLRVYETAAVKAVSMVASKVERTDVSKVDATAAYLGENLAVS